ncbi:MAG TPA: hypothetical protein VF088_20550 [Pyrinomonadaceae bacterium]
MTYEQVIESVKALVKGQFPEGKLQNRLLNLGLREFLEGDTIQKYGFPFRFLGQLDEAILTLAYFLSRFKQEGGTLTVYGLNKLSKGEDKTLSYWMTEKAKLYLEIQNMILLLDGIEGRRSVVKRIFTFKNISDIPFLTQSAISAISEQRASRIKIGFLFTDTFRITPSIEPISNTLIVHYEPATKSESESKPNFYELFEVPGNEQMHSLPYQQNCSSRWYRNLKEATKVTGVSGIEQARAKRLKSLLKTFEGPWIEFGQGDQTKVHRFPRVGNEFFNSALVMMYKAYVDSPQLSNLVYKPDQIIERFNERVVTQDLVRLERAMSTFDGESWARIRAVDSTSIKNSLRVHESEPTYRHWLRRGLNRVLREKSYVQLERIYILEDTTESAKGEYLSLERSMQYYLDYFHFEIAELAGIANKHKETYTRQHQGWEAQMWTQLKNRVKIYVTTRSVLNKFWKKLPAEYQQALTRMLDDFASDTRNSSTEALQQFTTLDYLCTDDMIYAFDNPRGDPGELNFNAYLLRKKLDVELEERILFNFSNEDILQPLIRQQTIQRMRYIIDSIGDYKRAYRSVPGFREKFKEFEARVAPIRSQLRSLPGLRGDSQNGASSLESYLENHSEILEDYPRELLSIRAEIESMLFDYFAPHVDYFFNVLRHLSVEVDFFESIDTVNIRKVFPFRQVEDSLGTNKRKTPSQELAKLMINSVDISHNFPLPPPAPQKVQEKTQKPEATQAKSLIRLLLLAANPIDTEFIHVNEEFHRIGRNVTFGPQADRFELRHEPAARVNDLTEHLLSFKPTIVHVTAHTRDTELLLTDPNGYAQPVKVQALKQVLGLHKSNIRCVVINACASNEYAEAIAEEIECAIGMSEAIKDLSAITFSSTFYKVLGYRESIKKAFDIAVAELVLLGLPGSTVPKLISRTNPETIFLLSRD